MSEFPSLTPGFLNKQRQLSRIGQLIWLLLFGYLCSKIISAMSTKISEHNLSLLIMLAVLLAPLVWHCASDKKWIDKIEKISSE